MGSGDAPTPHVRDCACAAPACRRRHERPPAPKSGSRGGMGLGDVVDDVIDAVGDFFDGLVR